MQLNSDEFLKTYLSFHMVNPSKFSITMVKIWVLLLALSIRSSSSGGCKNLTASDQLLRYKVDTMGQNFILTDENGAPVDEMDVDNLNHDPLDSTFFLESMTRITRERIPQQVVHTKGRVVFGYFEVTEDISDICKAKLFSEVGKKTPIAVRFSNQVADRGEADTIREAKGFSVKFYTEEGNFDLVALNFPVFAVKDATLFPSLVHALKRNPQSRLHDFIAVWDLITLRPETVTFAMYFFADGGLPNGLKYITGYPIHTYQLYNDKGVVSYVRFRFEPDAGVENLPSSEGVRIAGEDPDYHGRTLYEAILNSEFPSWTVSIQYMSVKDAKEADFNPFDVTLFWPTEQYPPKPIGKLVLNENVKNDFADNDLIAFSPGNCVPGVSGGADRMFEARRLTYLDAAHHRLGANPYKIKVNCPMMSEVNTYFRNGQPPVKKNGGNSPSYYPNSFNGPQPVVDKFRPRLNKPYVDPAATNFGQARDLYENQMDEGERGRLAENIVASLSTVPDFIKDKVVKMFTRVHPDFGERIANGLKNATKPFVKPVPIQGHSVH